MKIAFSAEFRFKVFGDVKGAIFADAGNIWNVLDNVTDEKAKFSNVNDLAEIALGSGFGLRYDLSFFVIRLAVSYTHLRAHETRIGISFCVVVL